ncbi:TauD/TfdA family dioxygenase [Micromonospora lutea]|uniref:Protein AmbC n=1 Tax=Micromonospora lutea TaxID=419825 RepID=A0ABQ4ITV0_9ACTN|nr:TauD/TfdA family dioxygenase [Micromonospora lutea]GIJ21063.1 protein AmbC [Micromonospora lutea]
MMGPSAGRRRPVAARPDESALRVVGAPTGRGLPLEVRPDAVGVSLLAYAEAYPQTLRGWLHQAGAVLFRGFDVTLEMFAAVARALAGDPVPYLERSSPRTEIVNGVYTSTEYPADQTIPLHNENSYQRVFPGLLIFGCQVAAERGGQTPVADVRRVLAAIPPDVVAPFAEHGVMYVRNFGGGLGLSWQEVFQTTSRDQVSRYCVEHGIEAEWRDDGGLRTRQVRPALATHPITGERVWFNHALFFNGYCLPEPVRAALLADAAHEDLPSHTYYGDGRPIPDEALAAIAEAYAAEEVAVDWRPGDVLLVDNLLASHGRRPFTGARRVMVSMADPVDWDAVGTPAQGRA